MNKKGFTLIEGLMVIAIIGVILLTLIPSVIVIINKNKQKNFEATRDSIVAAAKMYVAENKYDLNINCNGENEVAVNDVKMANIVGYGNLSSIPQNFPDIDVIYNCSTKKFSYRIKNTTTEYSRLTYEDISNEGISNKSEEVTEVATS